MHEDVLSVLLMSVVEFTSVVDNIPGTCPMKNTRHAIKERNGCSLIANYQIHSRRS